MSTSSKKYVTIPFRSELDIMRQVFRGWVTVSNLGELRGGVVSLERTYEAARVTRFSVFRLQPRGCLFKLDKLNSQSGVDLNLLRQVFKKS